VDENGKNGCSHNLGETGDESLDPPSDERGTKKSCQTLTAIGRRKYLGILGIGAASSIFGSRSANAQTEGEYGLGTYGLEGYGSESDPETTDPGTDDPPIDEPVNEEPSDDQPVEESPDGNTNDADTGEDSEESILTVGVDAESTSATLSGLLWVVEGVESMRAYLEYREVNTQKWSATTGALLTTWGAFEQQASGLSPSTGYEYRAVADGGDETVYGEIKTFQTVAVEEAPPSADLLSVTDSPNGDQTNLSVEWKVSDPKSQLENVTIVVSDYRQTLYWEEKPASGSTASGSETFSVERGNKLEVTLVVTDTAGNLDIQRTILN
jgi:hypothetical protein